MKAACEMISDEKFREVLYKELAFTAVHLAEIQAILELEKEEN